MDVLAAQTRALKHIERIVEHDHGDKWDAADVRLLRRLGPDPGISWAEVGRQLGRTGSACRSKWYRLR